MENNKVKIKIEVVCERWSIATYLIQDIVSKQYDDYRVSKWEMIKE